MPPVNLQKALLALVAVWALAGCGGDAQPGSPAKHSPPPKPDYLDASAKTGAQLYALHCQSCHGDKGQGVTSIFPPLMGSPRLQVGPHFVHGLIHGFPPPEGESPWMGEMPKFGGLSDADLARLANYVRQEYAAAPDVITVEVVAAQRANP